jgi:hypothetical protein
MKYGILFLFLIHALTKGETIGPGKYEFIAYWNSNNLNPKYNQARSGFFDIAGINKGINISKFVYRKKGNLIALFSGINHRVYRINFTPNLDFYPNFKDNINVSRQLFGLNFGFTLEKNIVNYKNLKIYGGAGIFGTVTMISPEKTVSFYYDIPNNSHHNYIIFMLNKNRHIYPYPFFQLKVNQRIKNETWVYGVKCNVSNDYTTKTNIKYKARADYLKNPNEAEYNFPDRGNQWELFIGINF